MSSRVGYYYLLRRIPTEEAGGDEGEFILVVTLVLSTRV